MCVNKNKLKHIDKKEVENKISDKKLRCKFMKQIDGKNNESAEHFVWHPTKDELNEFVTEETDCIESQTMQTSDESKFYCRMIVTEHKSKRYAAIVLNLFQLLRKQNQIIISCQFYCKQINRFYVRFKDVLLKLDEDENHATQIAFFEWE
eukprot:133160_1